MYCYWLPSKRGSTQRAVRRKKNNNTSFSVYFSSPVGRQNKRLSDVFSERQTRYINPAAAAAAETSASPRSGPNIRYRTESYSRTRRHSARGPSVKAAPSRPSPSNNVRTPCTRKAKRENNTRGVKK